MYHWIVERKVRRTFAALSTGDAGPMLAALAPRFTYRFYGQHALAGTRHTPEAMRLWWERVYRLFPTIGFEADEVLVRGWPWRTRISTIATVRAELPDGGAYENDMHQFMLLRWGDHRDSHYGTHPAPRVHACEDRARRRCRSRHPL